MRCWSRATLELPAGLVVVTGPNGAGKTSLIEAVTLACLGVSCRTTREAEAIREGAEALRVVLDLEGPDGLSHREIGYQPQLGRRLRRDGEPVRSLATWRAPGALLIFLPDELRAVKGPPAARRRALDRVLEGSEPGYAETLGGYQAALAQRNALLRRIRAGQTGPGGLAPWDERLASLGGIVARARTAAVAALSTPFATWLSALGGAGEGALRLETSPAERAAGAQPQEVLARGLAERREADLRAGQTLAGPHRDDLWIGAGTRDLRRAGSQGEQRTAVLALLLAARDHLAARGARPLLLLDDVLSELDPRRRELLLRALGGPGQAIVTSADPTAATAVEPAAVLRVSEGRLVG